MQKFPWQLCFKSAPCSLYLKFSVAPGQCWSRVTAPAGAAGGRAGELVRKYLAGALWGSVSNAPLHTLTALFKTLLGAVGEAASTGSCLGLGATWDECPYRTVLQGALMLSSNILMCRVLRACYPVAFFVFKSRTALSRVE